MLGFKLPPTGQIFNLVQKLMANPEQGIIDMISQVIPHWVTLEQEAGGDITFVATLSADKTQVIFSKYKVLPEGNLIFLQAFTIPELIALFKEKKPVENEPTVRQITAPTDTAEPGAAAPGDADGTNSDYQPGQ